MRALPIGVDNFYDIRKENYYYVDKTLLIKDLINLKGSVNVFTRPRRFGKSLNLSMLHYFFDITEKEHAHIFDGLKIKEAGVDYLKHQNAFPVIKLTLKGAEAPNFAMSLELLKPIIADEYRRHHYLLESDKLFEDEKEYIKAVMESKAGEVWLRQSLVRLSKFLYRHYDQKVIILLDEYDVPLEKAYHRGYYEEMVGFVRSFLGEALKTNDALNKAVVTGCLRVSKESIFTGINNLNMLSIMTNDYDEYFGLTESEVAEMFAYYELSHKLEEAKNWYNGYIFGTTLIYNPWSLIRHTRGLLSKERFPKSHWANSSSNLIIRELIQMADEEVKSEIEHLISGGTIEKPITEDIIYGDIKKNMNNLWNFLYFTGYLTKVEETLKGVSIYCELKIPNSEVQYIFERHIREWFQEEFIAHADLNPLYQAIENQDPEAITYEIRRHLVETISYLDSHENFYHGFLAGILKPMKNFLLKSNRESGDGRSDLFLLGKFPNEKALILEIKVADIFSNLACKAQEALQQIEDKKYVEELAYAGYEEIEKYGIAFCKKRCLVVKSSQ